jgi:putative ATPase
VPPRRVRRCRGPDAEHLRYPLQLGAHLQDLAPEGRGARVDAVEQQLHGRATRRGVVEQALADPLLALDLRRITGLQPIEQSRPEHPGRRQEACDHQRQPDGDEPQRVPGEQPSERGKHADSLPGVSDLFSAAVEGDAVAGTAPLAVRMRPRTLDEVVGQDHLLAAGSPLRRLVDGGSGPAGAVSVILWGPPGSGKTTLAAVISQAGSRRFVELNAVSAGVKDVRRVLDEARDAHALYRRETVLFLDEIHRFSKAQQDSLLTGVENRWVVLVAATTENPSFSVVSPLLSRSLVLTLKALDADAIGILVDRAVTDPRGLDGAVTLEPAARQHIVRTAAGDARVALNALEAAAGAALSRDEGGGEPGQGRPAEVTLEEAEHAVDRVAVRYDREGDQHYDVASAFIKSIRGSDVDAALHYLARMLDAGEDPRFVARRMIISASEDIGEADPTALPMAVAAAQAVQLIGMPEGRIVLAQAVVHLALAPKSNASYLAIGAALDDVRKGLAGPVPRHLRDASYPGAARYGHGKGYRYAHDDPRGVVEQQYAPEGLQDRTYYTPTDHGFERELGPRLERLRDVLKGRSEEE